MTPRKRVNFACFVTARVSLLTSDWLVVTVDICARISNNVVLVVGAPFPSYLLPHPSPLPLRRYTAGYNFAGWSKFAVQFYIVLLEKVTE